MKVCDVVTINCPLHKETEHMFNDQLISTMKRGGFLFGSCRRRRSCVRLILTFASFIPSVTAGAA